MKADELTGWLEELRRRASISKVCATGIHHVCGGKDCKCWCHETDDQ